MSLSGKAQPAFSQVFETVARRALAANTLIIAAAGNDSQRPSFIAPVGHPANCPSIMAVAALDLQLGIAPFSNGGLNPNGGGIDIAGPGVNVFSSVPLAFGTHGVLSGTSMATPHVAGIAALHLQARGLNTTAQALWQILVSTASRLNLPARDVGAGLVQAP
jgi:subtilisin family serine protease